MYAKISGILLALGATFTLACADSTSPSERTDTTPAGPAAGLSGPVHQIAYHNGGSVMLINSDGSGPALLASPGWTPSWSPDGKRLVFSNTQCDTDWDSYLICEVGGLVILNPETHEIVTPSAG